MVSSLAPASNSIEHTERAISANLDTGVSGKAVIYLSSRSEPVGHGEKSSEPTLGDQPLSPFWGSRRICKGHRDSQEDIRWRRYCELTVLKTDECCGILQLGLLNPSIASPGNDSPLPT